MDDRQVASKQPVAIFLMGPTAVGKTDLAISLAKRLPCEIISVDSALVYHGLDIGTAKPSAATLARFPHHLINIRQPCEPYSVADFRQDSLAIMRQLSQQGRIPLLVGGTMLYFKALWQGLSPLPSANRQLRERILQLAKSRGWGYIHQQLQQVDPVTAQRLHPNDSQRLQRALEVYWLTGKSLSQLQQALPDGLIDQWGRPYRLVQLALAPTSRQALHARIACRFHRMLQQGLLTEVAKLQQQGLDPQLPAIRAVGYRQAWGYLTAKLNFAEMVDQGIIATRQLAKRQLTWLRSWPALHWLAADDPDLVSHTLQYIKSELSMKAD
jgi:tRNA dimethylallyltransferase